MNPVLFHDAEACVDYALERLGRRVVLGTPLGIGKPIALLNALYRRAQVDPRLELDIITGLSLNAPLGGSELEQRFYRPIRARVWRDLPRLAYLDDVMADRLPANVRVIEFYVRAGSILGHPRAQQQYISSNYSHVARDMLARGVNLVMQAVAVREPQDGGATAEGARARRYSLSGNPDVTLQLLPLLEASGRPFLTVCQTNRGLPWFGHGCELAAERIQLLLDDPALDHAPFAVPHEPVDDVAWAIGLHAASLIRDGGTLQVGIGALGDAVCHALLLRAREDAAFVNALDALGRERAAELLGGAEPFREGLYAASELLSFPLFRLFEEGVIRRRVYEDMDAQRAALEHPEAPPTSVRGTALQGAFFLGSAEFYRRLRALPEEQRDLIDMTCVAEVNRVYTHYKLEHLQRRHARFLNVTLKATLLGAAISDQLEDGQVLSGVGGQSDFVAMAHQLPGGRSALLLRATVTRAGELESNIVWQYVHTTIPRHMRDLFVTEYGVADLRGKTDAECIEAMLAIADSRFQDSLLAQAKRAGKLPFDARIPEARRGNLPARIAHALTPARSSGALPDLPFGSDLTEREWALAGRLKRLQAASEHTAGRLRLARALSQPAPADDPPVRAALEHLALAAPTSAKERLLARLVRAAYRL